MASGRSQYAGINRGRSVRAGQGKASAAKQRNPSRKTGSQTGDFGAPF